MFNVNDILIYYINEDYHNLIYDHISGHSSIDYEILDYVSSGMFISTAIQKIDLCQECCSYKVKVVNNDKNVLIYAANQVENVVFYNATVIAESDGSLGNFKLSESTDLYVDSNSLLFGKMFFAGDVSISDNVSIRLDIDKLQPSKSGAIYYLINDLKYIADADFFLIDSVNVEQGIYCIAPDNIFITKGITVKNSNGEVLGILNENQNVEVRGLTYSLVNYYDYLAVSVSSNPMEKMTDEVYEWLAHTKAYEDLALNATFSLGNYLFKVVGVIHDNKTGLDAYCVLRLNKDTNEETGEAVILFRGTADGKDVLADFNATGLADNQIAAGLEIITQWVDSLKRANYSIDFTGHSLGGSLCQQFASRFGARNVITFSSPGTTLTTAAQPATGRVRHYLNSGDLIPLAGNDYVSGEYILSFKRNVQIPATSIRTTKNVIDFFGSMHSDKELSASEFVIRGMSSELEDSNFGYIATQTENGNYIFDTNYAKAVLLLSLGNVTVANLFTSRARVENARKTIGEILQLCMNYENLSTAEKTIVLVNGLPVLKPVTYSVTGAILTYGVINIAYGLINECILFSPTHNSSIYNVFTDNDNIPDILFNVNTQEFIPIDIVNNTEGNIHFCTNENGFFYSVYQQDSTLQCFVLPDFSVSERFTLSEVIFSDGTTTDSENIRNDGMIILSQNATSFDVKYDINHSIVCESGKFCFPGNITKEDETIIFYLLDIDAQNRNDITVKVYSASNTISTVVSMQKTDVEGVFVGTLLVSVDAYAENDYRLFFEYEDFENNVGVSERISGILELKDYWQTGFFKNLEQRESDIFWSNKREFDKYNVEIFSDDSDTVATFITYNNGLDVFTRDSKLNLQLVYEEIYSSVLDISSNLSEIATQKISSDADGNMDLFFANANGTWIKGYAAEHHGILYGWDGTGERVSLKGKNQLSDIFAGSSDANILVMTDDANGDTLFMDDIYSVFGEQARIAQIDEIRAGAGDDVVDMTSQRYSYSGDGVKIYGGLGNDTIWSNNGSNILFGDAGNDRIVGGGDNDVIIGGSGNDSMHGGGGNDIFCFGGDWGIDTIEQLANGSVTLWFENGSVSNWDVATMTYSDGVNSVKVSGVDNVTLKFGNVDTAVAGAFLDVASEKIFEDKNKGMIA